MQNLRAFESKISRGELSEMANTSRDQEHLRRRLCSTLTLFGVLLNSHAANAQTSPGGSAENSTGPTDETTVHEAETAPSNTDAFAQRHWHSGMAYLEEGEHEKALEAFTKAYELSGRPALLRSIAVAHEKLGDVRSAIAAIELYLRQVPNAADIEDIRTYRADLQARLEKEALAPTNPPPPEAAGANEDATLVRESYVLPQSELPEPPTPAHDENAREVVVWSAAGAGVALGALAVWTGLAAKSKFTRLEETCQASCTREQTHEGRTLALTSTVLTGLAALAGGAALWAWLDDDDNAARGSAAGVAASLELSAGYADHRFMSHAQWSF